MEAMNNTEANPEKILVVDDEERIRNLLRLYLEREGYEIDEADEGETALNKALEENYQLIILDLMLPKMDGIEVCRKLREKKSTPVIMLTARGKSPAAFKDLRWAPTITYPSLLVPGNSFMASKPCCGVRRRTNIWMQTGRRTYSSSASDHRPRRA